MCAGGLELAAMMVVKRVAGTVLAETGNLEGRPDASLFLAPQAGRMRAVCGKVYACNSVSFKNSLLALALLHQHLVPAAQYLNEAICIRSDMENRRNSGSYSSRIANQPPPQPLPDGYPQKRSASYRRPIEPQPTLTEQPPPLTANTVSSNSARPVAAPPAQNGVSRTSTHRRRQSQQIPSPASGAVIEPLPAAPDVPRGPPPTSYRDPWAPKGSSRPNRSYSGRSRDPTIQVNASRQQPNIQIAPSRLQELRTTQNAGADPPAGATEGEARRGSQARRPSVPDRSPLQKLEGKLDDISKEERRARMLEAELAAQEKAEAERAARRAREAAAKQQINVSGPLSSTERATNGPGRTSSTRRHASLPTKPLPKHPDSVESDDEGPIYDLSEPWDPTGGTQAQSQRNDDRLVSGVTSFDGLRQKNRQSTADVDPGRKPNVKGKEPVGITRGPSFRERTGTTGNRIDRKPVGQPTGLGLVGVDDNPQVPGPKGATGGRHDTKRLSKDLPPAPYDSFSSNGKSRDSRGIAAAQKEMEQHRIDHKQGTRSFDQLTNQPIPPPAIAPVPRASVPRHGVDFAPSTQVPQPRESTESVDPNLPDVFHLEQDRRYIAPPVLNEWRNAPVGTLSAEDLDVDTPERSDSTNKAWWEESTTTRRRRSASYTQPTYDGYIDEPTGQTSFNPPLYLKCGPLLRYTGIRKDKTRPGKEREIWRGSIMIVTIDEQSSYQKPPILRLFKQTMDLLPPPPVEVDADGQHLNPAYVDPIEGQIKMGRTGKTLYVKPIEDIVEGVDLSREENENGLFQETRINSSLVESNIQKSRVRKKDGEKAGRVREVPGIRLHAERGVTFWRFNIEVELGSTQTRIAYRINRGPAIGFWVPAKGESMNIMFHSCNGFSLSVDSKDFCGPDPLWRDVLNNHQTRPFHVMIGGGDQIYNDAAMRDTKLFRQWTESRNPMHKHHAGFSTQLQNELEQFYLDRYSMWFSQGLFGMANSQIPMINIWDDHDIIDGYGSYPHHFMQTPVFTGLGAVAFKYYMLFQHQSVITETEKTEPSWILGVHPGPYIKEHSRNLFMSLGGPVAFLGLDCRTERQRDEVLENDTYYKVLDLLKAAIIRDETKHLIVLLGVPIAYPRLNFLENILTSRLMDPIKALGRAGLLGNFVNKFDGGVEILDDLDDHWTAKHHKDERNWFIEQLQSIAQTKSVRVTILGGDVHLAAVGQFFTNKKLNIPKDKDFRYMPNVISSAIVNTPPPEMMADILNKRNKIHHLDPYTDEDMIPLFTHDVDGKKRNNTHLLPRRNYCTIREYKPGTTPPRTPSPPPSLSQGPRLSRTLSDFTPGQMVRRMSSRRASRAQGPPVAYYNNPTYAAADEAAAARQSSFSPEPDERPRSRRASLSSLFRRRASVDSVNPPSSAHSMPTPRKDSFTQDRPSPFHRRPSLLKRGTLKGTGDFINLEGGLDVILNLEVSQKDPAGITMPYRLLIPALDCPPPTTPAIEKSERRKSRIGSMLGVFGSRKRGTIGEDGYSRSGSEISDNESDISSEDDGERTRRRYKVGPRIMIPGLSRRRDRDRDRESKYRPHDTARYPDADRNHTSIDYTSPPPTSRQNVPTLSSTIPSRTPSNRQPMYNSSHKSQLPHPSSHTYPEPADEQAKVHRRSMGGILNQHRGADFEHDAHVLAHTPSTKQAQDASRRKRESYPPHPAIVGKGPGSPYQRTGVEARDDYFGSRKGSRGEDGTQHHHHHHHHHRQQQQQHRSSGQAEGSAGSRWDSFGNRDRDRDAGVGARYLGHGRYEDEEDSDEGSADSFVPPRKRGWRIWR
ncbi:hypothetical protein CC78DRAFT_548121 [Lojkania enalia]|uniref:PhoD-like phosphatase domain-containing protein n=1 Tax=Lojkania enalia TaxID=147567 RepID=A0A9P4K3W7_9PLEO|nr:hypothetical protein CC78DRAFT_548121 [Didymosphaeria enalia]